MSVTNALLVEISDLPAAMELQRLGKEELFRCPRCSGQHPASLIKRLNPPITDPSPADPQFPCTFASWALCPLLEEPILFRQTDTEQDLFIPLRPKPEAVANFAHYIWTILGCPSGQDVRHWLLAEAGLTSFMRVISRHQLIKLYGQEASDEIMTAMSAALPEREMVRQFASLLQQPEQLAEKIEEFQS